jgi:hypothetical protein
MEEVEQTYNYYLKLFCVKDNRYTKNDYFNISDDGQLHISFTDHCYLYDVNSYKIYKRRKPSFFFNRDIELCNFTSNKELFIKVRTFFKKSIRAQKLKELV